MPHSPAEAMPFGYRLDNSAKIYVAQHSRRRTTMLRFSAVIDKPVNIALLEKAFGRMLDRCPYYKVHLRRGVFWYYLESHEPVPRVEAESCYPCLYVPLKRKETPPYRLIAYRDRIAFEVSHLLTDGWGALRFLNGLLLEYLRLRGETIDAQGLLMEADEEPDPEEHEDSFFKYYEKKVPSVKLTNPSLQFSGTPVKAPVFFFTQGILEGAALKEQASRFGVTIGDFLTALLIKVCLDEMKRRNMKPRPIRISVPINVRAYFPSRTMRNFTLVAEPGIDPRLGDFTFEEIVKKVHHYMRLELDHRDIRRQISRNIRSERHPLVRIIPLFIKVPALKFFYTQMASRRFTLSFSNMGQVKLPEEMRRFVKSYQLIPPPHRRNISVTAIAYGGKTSVFFSTTMEERDIERRFFSGLRQMGVPVSIRTNRS